MSDAVKAMLLRGLKELGCEAAKLLGSKIVTVASDIQQEGQTKTSSLIE